MGVYAVTGAGSGIGRATSERLVREGHTVIGVDLKNTDVIADLSSADRRITAANDVLQLADHRLDGSPGTYGGSTAARRLTLAIRSRRAHRARRSARAEDGGKQSC